MIDGKKSLSEWLERFDLLSDEEIALFVSYFKEARIKKRQYIVQPNFVAQNRHFVVKGAFRSFVICDLGKDHTISFAIENWWISDYNSYIYQKPATSFVVALEDSTILKIPYESEQKLKELNHKYERIFRIMAERGLAFLQRRHIANITLSAEKNYEKFINEYPQIASRLPQYALASYLGMTTEFLSRIRNRKTPKS